MPSSVRPQEPCGPQKGSLCCRFPDGGFNIAMDCRPFSATVDWYKYNEDFPARKLIAVLSIYPSTYLSIYLSIYPHCRYPVGEICRAQQPQSPGSTATTIRCPASAPAALDGVVRTDRCSLLIEVIVIGWSPVAH